MTKVHRINNREVPQAEWEKFVEVLRQVDPHKTAKIIEDNEVSDIEMNRLLDRNGDRLVRHDDFKGISDHLFNQLEHILSAYRFNASRLWTWIPPDYPFSNIPKCFWSRRDFLLKAINKDGKALKYADDSFKKDREVVLKAIQKWWDNFEYADESLKKDKSFVLEAIKKDGRVIKYADAPLKRDKEVVLAAIRRDNLALEYADDALKDDKEVVLLAVGTCCYGSLLKFAGTSLKKDKEVVLAAMSNNKFALQYADESVRRDKKFVLSAVRESGYVLEYADPSLKSDREVVLAAVKNCGMALRYAKPSFNRDREVVIAAVRQNGWALEYVGPALKRNKEVALIAVKQNGMALQYADATLKRNKEVVLAAVRQNASALEHADAALKRDKDVVIAAVSQNQDALRHAHSSLQNDKDVARAYMRSDTRRFVDYCKESGQNDSRARAYCSLIKGLRTQYDVISYIYVNEIYRSSQGSKFTFEDGAYYEAIGQITARNYDAKKTLQLVKMFNAFSGLAGFSKMARELAAALSVIGERLTNEELAAFGHIIQENETAKKIKKMPHAGKETALGMIRAINSTTSKSMMIRGLYEVLEGPKHLSFSTLTRYAPIHMHDYMSYKDIWMVEKHIGIEGAWLLYKKFNITRFGRYNKSVLEHLVRIANDPNYDRHKPLVVALVAKYDDASVFYFGKRFQYDPRVRLVVQEIDGDFASVLPRLKKIYGTPDVLFITAHGTAEQMAGTGVDVQSAEDLRTRMKRLYGNRPPQIVLNSCSTGAAPAQGTTTNIAQMLANIFNTEVVAPKADEALLKLSLKVGGDGRARLRPTYYEVGPEHYGLNFGGKIFRPNGNRPLVASAGNNEKTREGKPSCGPTSCAYGPRDSNGRPRSLKARIGNFLKDYFTGKVNK